MLLNWGYGLGVEGSLVATVKSLIFLFLLKAMTKGLLNVFGCEFCISL